MTGRFIQRSFVLVALAIAATALAAGLAWYAALEAGKQRAIVRLDGELQVLARSVDSEIERFRYLPSIVARDGRIRAALQSLASPDIEAADRYLFAVRADSRADELYVMNATGLTIAASNYAEPSSFVGQNYRFRPYFQDALTHGSGRYYAVGVTTGEPGYFLSSIIRDGDAVLGVAVVKVDMRGLETAWSQSRGLAALSDRDGVVFLTGHDEWKYRPFDVLDRDALDRIATTRKYDGVDLAAAAPIFGEGRRLSDEVDIPESGGLHLLRSVAIEPDGWRLWSAATEAPIRANALLFGLLAALAGLLVSGAGFYLRQRRQLIRAKLDQHDLLERRVVERTAELREAQASLIQAAKLAALGRMSTAIVHEVAQPLAAMENTLAATGLLARRGDKAAVAAKVGEARELVKRIQRTVKSLKSFARKEPARLEPVDVDKAIAVAVELAAHRAAAERVQLAVMTLDEPAFVEADAIRLEQVLLNLVANALDAVHDSADPRVAIWPERAGGAVRIHVRDNGPGIGEDVRDRIAEPFFTTKLTGEGLGLGLSISRAIVGEIGGTIDFASSAAEGCVFTVCLPALATAREAAE